MPDSTRKAAYQNSSAAASPQKQGSAGEHGISAKVQPSESALPQSVAAKKLQAHCEHLSSNGALSCASSAEHCETLQQQSSAAAGPQRLSAAGEHKSFLSSDSFLPSSSISQQSEAAASSMRFTPEQQSVAAALMVVMKRAMKDREGQARPAKETLIRNNRNTQYFLDLIPSEGGPPSLRAIEQSAPPDVFKTLSVLAQECAAAGCQPLDVFTRSLQCTPEKGSSCRTASKAEAAAGQGALDELWDLLHERREIFGRESSLEETTRALTLQVADKSPRLAFLANVFPAMFTLAHEADCKSQKSGVPAHPARSFVSDLHHLLPGRV